ncbi:uncharacterized protein LOC111829726 isoform X2 [Capsella rubella]|uniref:uncharacterized protein LOC111829726 isoform X2 n=1 Tax=Capsella rubella TaxID=81985 RepID=UPI000CD541D1|nr:uncharacterized protein LOC111829726 isoform X2 [Capsella rubella]
MVLTDAQILELKADMGRIEEVIAKPENKDKDWRENKEVNDIVTEIIARFGSVEKEAAILTKFKDEIDRVNEGKTDDVELLI